MKGELAQEMGRTVSRKLSAASRVEMEWGMGIHEEEGMDCRSMVTVNISLSCLPYKHGSALHLLIFRSRFFHGSSLNPFYLYI